MIAKTVMEAIAELMNPEIGEMVHFRVAPCTTETFLNGRSLRGA